jgi:hypothetical protein
MLFGGGVREEVSVANQVEALEGQEPAEMNSVMQGLIASANHDARPNRILSTYTASNPSPLVRV